MNLSVFTLVLLSIFLYGAQGIRFERSIISGINHQELITKTSSSNHDDGSTMVAELSPGLQRKFMTEMIFSSPITINSKNYKDIPYPVIEFPHGKIGKEKIRPTSSVPVKHTHEKTEVVLQHYPGTIDIIGLTDMDYSSVKTQPPKHN